MYDNIKINEDEIKQFIYAYKNYVDTRWVDLDGIVMYVKNNLPETMRKNDIYNFIADYCVSKTSTHPDYNKLASRICVDRLHQMTSESMLDVVEILHDNKSISNGPEYSVMHDEKNQIIDDELLSLLKELGIPLDEKEVSYSLISENLLNNVRRFNRRINETIKHERDYLFDYFGIRTLERSYLLKIHGGQNEEKIIVERPQHLIMRVALGIHGANIDAAIETYELISLRYFTHATPTLFNAGREKAALSSCFLLGVNDDLQNIGDQHTQMMMISKWAGGIGIHLSEIRSKGSIIKKTNGKSDGIVPLSIMINKMARYVNQGGNRPGSVACYLEPHHADVFDFCELRKSNTGNDDTRARDLYLALWVPDLFMKRVENDEMWSLMCPNKCKKLSSVYGAKFEKLYEYYESKKKYKRQVRARDLWRHILECQMETGFPYMLYKDNANNKSNQKNLGTIRSSNLCVHGETLILTDEGYVKIGENVNKKFNIWNGEEWSKVTFKKTGSNKDLIRINLNNGAYVDCTPEHKFYINKDHKIVQVMAQNLNVGDMVINTKFNFAPLKCNPTNNVNTEVPINESIENKMVWLENFYNKCGKINDVTIHNNNIELCHSLLFESDTKELLINVRLLLNTLGIDSNISYNSEHENNIYKYNLNISSSETVKLQNLNFFPLKNISLNNCNCGVSEDTYTVQVKSINKSYKNVDTYCFTEPKKNMGVFNGILAGNCAEIIEYSDANTTAVCNLASICLPRFVVKDDETNEVSFDYKKLMEVTRVIVRNLNKVIDRTYYPSESARESNKQHRPIGIGVQGLSDVYNMFSYPFDSTDASTLNKRIFETIYYASVDESMELAKKHGHYSSFKGSPFSEGKLQYHLWGMKNESLETYKEYDWNKLVENVKTFGTRNSLLTALMPTAGTSQIMKCYESFEPYMSNLFVRTTMAGEFVVINERLINDLIKLDLWNEDMRKKIIIKNGSIQEIQEIPDKLKNIYKTAFELSLKNIIGQSADRAPFIDQSQSMNLFMNKLNFTVLTSAHFYGWKRGLKTGMYYLRTTPAVNAVQFGIDISEIMRLTGTKNVTDLIANDYGVSSANDYSISTTKSIENNNVSNRSEEVNDDEKDMNGCPIGCTSCGS